LEGYIFICDREYRFVTGVELERLDDGALADEEEYCLVKERDDVVERESFPASVVTERLFP